MFWITEFPGLSGEKTWKASFQHRSFISNMGCVSYSEISWISSVEQIAVWFWHMHSLPWANAHAEHTYPDAPQTSCDLILLLSDRCPSLNLGQPVSGNHTLVLLCPPLGNTYHTHIPT